ncbi:hypothetical protein Desac_2154 [Desulfobacca acetoxidans DSM 11109]|uniref:Uncharacterized protein n=1 Tax=Desulfobacca acetoxidans (strain ATCC 700848 / DSM 11109 / ASRB2) TaxID=880072 RepID=F2NDB7_DESAR|nr:hypothetical protein Desac_2154 [Desulfobacca acetoxidans DSM 11109]HAY21936.1 hypothetical protein [Desulfobacterales bacterium]
MIQEQSVEPPPVSETAATLTLAKAVQNWRDEQLDFNLPSSSDQKIPDQRQLDTTYAYLTLLQELEAIREMLRAPGLPVRTPMHDQKPWTWPSPEILHYSLQIIGHTLREIKALMG